ncbi:transglutaminase-like cysteine peptidase [Orrella sp. 11846]|uniref:transglutaminase-like cysteine peptidase n=1 Tax=Orrella sp. 11846 TaxID=3409913 RepID=UPI003B5CB2CB
MMVSNRVRPSPWIWWHTLWIDHQSASDVLPWLDDQPSGLLGRLKANMNRPRYLARLCVKLILIALCALSLTLDVAALQFEAPAIVQYTQTEYGQDAARRVQNWLTALTNHQNKKEADQLREVNGFWNQHVRGAEDIDIWGDVDYWATPIETLSKAAGDCEDFVIGKYFSLLHLGVDPEKLRFIYVRAQLPGSTPKGIAHMVLGYYAEPDAEPLILDNLNKRILPASKRKDLKPVFSFNAGGLYVPGSAGSESVNRIGHWRDLLRRMRLEGFEP